MEKMSMISKNIKALRMKSGASQEQMAKKMNVTRQTISNWENGKSIPDAEQLNQIASLYQTDVNKLMNEESSNECPKEGSNLIWILLLISNIVIAVASLVYTNNVHEGYVFKAVLIPAGPPILISLIVWFVLNNSLKSGDYNLIAGYNEKYDYNKPVLRKMVKFIQCYTILISFISNFVLAVLVFFPEYSSKYIYVFAIYLINLFAGIIYINVRYKESLYTK